MTVVGKWMQLEVIMSNRINQTWKDKYIFFLLQVLYLYMDIHTYTYMFIYVSICHKTRKGHERGGRFLSKVGKGGEKQTNG